MENNEILRVAIHGRQEFAVRTDLFGQPYSAIYMPLIAADGYRQGRF